MPAQHFVDPAPRSFGTPPWPLRSFPLSPKSRPNCCSTPRSASVRSLVYTRWPHRRGAPRHHTHRQAAPGSNSGSDPSRPPPPSPPPVLSPLSRTDLSLPVSSRRADPPALSPNPPWPARPDSEIPPRPQSALSALETSASL